MGLTKPTEALTTRMGEQLLGYVFMGLNVKFRSDLCLNWRWRWSWWFF